MFDFGTHANDFLVRREESLATETFLVRVPGDGAVPEHVHTDMEQTFVFISGVGEATLSRDGDQNRRFSCVPGDMVFVPAGWRHTVLAQSVEGLPNWHWLDLPNFYSALSSTRPRWIGCDGPPPNPTRRDRRTLPR